MIDYKKVYSDIQKLKKEVQGLTFEQALERFCGYNGDSETFDIDYGDFSATIYNENGFSDLWKDQCYTIWDSDYTDNGHFENLTEQQIKESII